MIFGILGALVLIVTATIASPTCLFSFYTLQCSNASNEYYDNFIDSGFDHDTKVIKCQSCELETIEEYMFNKNPKWTFNLLDIEIIDNQNELSLIDTPFRGLLLLEWLKLYNSKIKFINFNSFEGIPNLKYLFLQNNDITNLPRKVFNELTNIIKINLNNNQIDSISDDAFYGLFTLRELSLSGNRLSRIDSSHFTYLRSLKLLQLGDNPIMDLDFNLLVESIATVKFISLENLPCTTMATLLLDNSVEKKFGVGRYVGYCNYTKKGKCLFVKLVRNFDRKSVIISSVNDFGSNEINVDSVGYIPCRRN